MPVDPGELLDSLQEMLTHTLGPASRSNPGRAQLPALLADKAQLETVLVNLAVNARDAMPDGGSLTIAARPEAGHRCRTRPALAAGHYIRVTITDTGAGMDPATLARAGEPFFTTKPLGQGTGLGLAMARGFTEQSGGAIAIASTPGQGTTVTLLLPQAGDCATPEPEPAPALAPPHDAVRVLLVDDDAMVRLTLAEHLIAAGYQITQAADGLDALARLDAGQPADLLVTDFAMPGMNGLSLIQEARRRLPALPAILLTGFADATVRERVAADLAAGTILLSKPIAPDDLAARAGALLRTLVSAE